MYSAVMEHSMMMKMIRSVEEILKVLLKNWIT